MGFRSGAYATVWSVERISDVNTKCRISISRKNRQTGEYTDDFNGFVSFFGTANASKALALKQRDRIRLGDVDVRSTYDREKKITYYNFNIYSFEMAGNFASSGGAQNVAESHVQQAIDSAGDGDLDDDRLPF